MPLKWGSKLLKTTRWLHLSHNGNCLHQLTFQFPSTCLIDMQPSFIVRRLYWLSIVGLGSPPSSSLDRLWPSDLPFLPSHPSEISKLSSFSVSLSLFPPCAQFIICVLSSYLAFFSFGYLPGAAAVKSPTALILSVD